MKKTTTNLALAIAVGFLASGCTATLHHGKIDTTPLVDRGPIGVAERAQDMGRRVGWGTLTVFAIPIFPVHVEGEPDKELMNQIKDAVTQAGYQIKVVDGTSSTGSLPVLSCIAKQFYFRNYTYFFPIVFNWGTIQLAVAITGPNGKVLWHKIYTGKGHGAYDFNSPVNKALTIILNELSSDLANSSLSSLHEKEIGEICAHLNSASPNEVDAALRHIRSEDAPDTVPLILPCLKSSDQHVMRDACRTLAVLGNKDTIPYIEPLLQNSKSSVRKDAQDAIDKLRAK